LALCHRSTCTTTSLSLSLCTSRPPTIHSFPTRRSSDLALVLRALAPCHRQREPDQGQHHHDDDDQHDDLGCGHAPGFPPPPPGRSEEHTSELQSRENLVCRLLLEKKKRQRTGKQ